VTGNTYRAVLWHRGQLPPKEMLSFYDLHIDGPSLSADGTNPIRFHTYACLFPERGIYVAENTGDWPDCSINPIELRQIIAEAEVSREKILDQREVTAQYVGPGASDNFRWDFALSLAMSQNLPIAFYTVGNTLTGNERVVYLRVVAIAPLAMVIAKFKEVAPQISLN
jgi:hypothetical protein